VRLVLIRRTVQESISAAQLEDTLGLPVFASIANDYAIVSQAINMGKPLCGGPVPEGRAGRDLSALARRLVPSDPSANPAPTEEVKSRRAGGSRFFRRG
jgi:Flp pilus assembly CpaE family ATPase